MEGSGCADRVPPSRSRLHFLAKQIAPPKEWAQFEDLCLALFKEVWKDPLAQKNGRKGQPQRGVDVYGSKGGDPRALWGVQCKGRDANYGGKPTRTELEAELAKAESFKPTLAGWVFATTAPTDGALQEAAREISLQRTKSGGFPCLRAWVGGDPSASCDGAEGDRQLLSRTFEQTGIRGRGA